MSPKGLTFFSGGRCCLTQDCIFCKIINKEIPAEIVYENDSVLVFKDIRPVAPVHLLLIPKKHIPTFFDLEEKDSGIMGDLQLAAGRVAREMGLEKGFRLISNCNQDAGQLVFHIHYHLIGGRPLHWPPG
ncbi:MAG: histidine triad nucleotide-binding protein [Firmicutes bacterium]|nr:histidine triad nucleotide-binding protein [Bacillota bacterium]MCL5057077.1 histidine triad nucleotide-binding protein [Actinomycetota bacterium]